MLYPVLLLMALAGLSWLYSAFPGLPYGDWALMASFGLLVCAAIWAAVGVVAWLFGAVIRWTTGSP